MAEFPRRGTRPVRLNQDHFFSYDEENTRFLATRSNLNEIARVSEAVIQSEEPVIAASAGVSESSDSPLASASRWLGVFESPHQFNIVPEGVSHSIHITSDCASVSRVRTEVSNDQLIATSSASVNNKDLYSGVSLRRSSTNVDFLDYSFDSVEQARSDISVTGMPGTQEQVMGESNCGCGQGNSCEVCRTVDAGPVARGTAEAEVHAGPEPSNRELMAMMRLTLKKVELMSSEVKNSRSDINAMQFRLQNLESSRPSSLRGLSSQAESSQGEVEFSLGASEDEAEQSQRAKLNKITSAKDKKGRIEQEKERGLRIVREKIRDRSKLDSFSLAEGEESGASGIFELRDVRKKMSKKLKDACEEKVAGRIKEAGAVFPAEESTSSGNSSSGTDDSGSGRRSRRRRKVKSGAKLIRRPVKNTELWPHIVSNEEDGGELTCETISLPKFLSCFSAIMISCGSKTERAGRALLLKAFSSVFECLPWVEARTFHNLVMHKIEQGRISWKTDFSDLAEKFLNHKVRLSLRSKGSTAGASSSFRPGRSNFPKGSGNSSFRQGFHNANRGKFNSTICKLWNSGTCSFGDACKYRHVCWTCAEAGKPGEGHKASSHTSSAR